MSSSRHSSIRRVLVPEASRASSANSFVSLGPDKIKHLSKVLRLEWGETVHVTDGQGSLFEARFERQGDGGGVSLQGLIQKQSTALSTELIVCLPKNSTMDWVVEKAVECGVARIQPVVSSRSVVKPDLKEIEKYARRWQAIMDGAVEQSERLWRPTITAPLAWREWIRKPSQARSFAFVSETRGDLDEAEALRASWSKLLQANQKRVQILIGPEGGFSEEERDELVQAGVEELSLGPSVFRVETAVVAALTMLRVSQAISTS